MSNDGCLYYLILGVIAIMVISFLASIALYIAGLIAAGGVVYGGGLACRNYAVAFKHNILDANGITG
ncbi:MAG: hypothetical protein IKE43_07745 [Coriobacteriales bacterium]|nr:hypothetical protein [Coriobacteriales bacterium]